MNVQLSFKSFDVPVLVGDQIHAGPLIGHHYFGDFQVPLSYAWDLRHSISPYLRPAPEQYPPFAQALFLPLSYFSLNTSAVIYFVLSAAVLLVPLWLLLAPIEAAYRVIFLVPVAILTTPFISIFDRGNNVGITVGLVAWALWAWRKERWILCAVVLVLAIGLKAYPAALLVVPFAYRRYKFTAIVATSAVAANLLVLAFYPGGFMRNLREVWPALKSEYSPTSQLSSWSMYSVIPKTAGLLFGPSAVDRLLAPNTVLLWLPSLLYLFGLYFVIRRARVPQWCWGPLTLASLQLLVPVSFVYTTAWAALAAVWYARGSFIDVGEGTSTSDGATDFVTLRIMLLLALTATLAPSVFTITGAGGFEAPLTMYLSPVLILVTLVVAVVHSLQPATVRPIPDLVD